MLGKLKALMSGRKASDGAAPPLSPVLAQNLPVVAMDAAELQSRGIARRELGEVELPSGRIVGCDPLTFADMAPFARAVPPGRYPATVWAEDRDGQLGDVGLLATRVSDAPVATWELALREGQDAKALKDGEFFGMAVDAGMVALADAETMKAAEFRHDETAEKEDSYFDDVDEAAFENRAALLTPVPGEPGNMAICNSGGDGYFPCLWGLDAQGAPVVLVADLFAFKNASA